MTIIRRLLHNFSPLLLGLSFSLILAGYYHTTNSQNFSHLSTTETLSSPALLALTSALDSVLPAEGKGTTRIIPLAKDPTQYLIFCKFNFNQNHEAEQRDMEKIARDFIFASYETAYAHNLNLVSSTIFIKTATGKAGLTLGLGKNLADTLARNTWSNRTTPPTEFIAWMKANRHNAPDAFQKCSYSGIYAK